MYQLLRLLSIAGEFPSRSLGILGDTRTVKAMVHIMESAYKFRLYLNGTVLSTKLFQLSGKRNNRTVRLNKTALPLLNDIHPEALDYYLTVFPDNKFSGSIYHIERNHRVGETIAMFVIAGIESMSYLLPSLQKKSIDLVIPEKPSYYVARDIKKIFDSELNKTSFTRVTGLLFYPGNSYAVYNTSNAVMKWNGKGELKAKLELSEIVRMNAGHRDVISALLFGASEDVALKTVIESDRSYRKQGRFDKIYQYVHFVPLDRNGINLLKILTLPDWNEKLMKVLFAPEMRLKGYGSFEYDAYFENKYVYSHLDSDIARLIRFKEAVENYDYSFEVLCFSWQVAFLRAYLGKSVILKQIEMSAVLKALKIE